MAPHLSQRTIGWLFAGASLLFFITLGGPSWGSKPREKNGVWIFPVKTTGLMLYLMAISAGIALCIFAHWVVGLIVIVACGLAWPLPVRADDAGLITGTLIYRTSMNWDAMVEIRDWDNPQGGDGIIIAGKYGDRFVVVRQFYDTEDIANFVIDRLHIPYVTSDRQNDLDPISLFGSPPDNK